MKEIQKNLKEFFATSWAIDNRTSIYVLTIIITMLGVLSYISIPKEQFPEIIIPTIIVNTPYPGTSPEDMENLEHQFDVYDALYAWCRLQVVVGG